MGSEVEHLMIGGIYNETVIRSFHIQEAEQIITATNNFIALIALTSKR